MDNFEEFVDDAFDILETWVETEQEEPFHPEDYDYLTGIDWDKYVFLIPNGLNERRYFTPAELVNVLSMVRDEEIGFPSYTQFGCDERGVYSEVPPLDGYKVMGWTPEMQKWIDENID